MNGSVIGERVKLAAATRRISIRELARRVKATAPTVRGTSYGGIRALVEGDIQNPRGEMLHAIAEVLGVSYEWLADGEPATPTTGNSPTVDVDAALRRIDRIMAELKDLRDSLLPPPA